MNSHQPILGIEELASDLALDKAIYKYVGLFDKESTDQVIIDIDNLLNSDDYSGKLKKRTFHITIEVTQNLYKYLSEKKADNIHSHGLFVLHGNKEGLIVTSGNYVKNKEINSLKARIKLINSLTNDELAHFYRGLLDIGSVTDQGGAGLGFVDIAKKSGSKIQYEFKSVDDQYSFYIFRILISN